MNTLPDLIPSRWVLTIAPRAASPLMLELVARLAQRGPVRVLDGGDRFQARVVAREVRRGATADGPVLHEALARISLARAFTCYQMVTLLSNTPTSTSPTLILDLLSTFYDESVALKESQRLLDLCLIELNRLASQGPLAVSVRPPRLPAERICLVETLAEAADQVFQLEPPAPPSPLSLWDAASGQDGAQA